MIALTRFLLVALGASAIVIGLLLFFAGPDQTATLFSWLVQFVTGSAAYSGGLAHPNVDSEMRFFSVFWMAYGAGLLWLSPRLLTHQRWVFAAIALFFTGGLGRLLSFMTYGAPDPLFVVLLVIEIGGPVFVTATYWMGLRARL